MSVSSACPHCQQPLPDGFIGRTCPHCGAAIGNKRKRSLSGFSFQTMQPGAAGSSDTSHPSTPPREIVEDRWDLPDQDAGTPVGVAVPLAASTGFPAVPSPRAAPAPRVDPLRSTASLDPFSWDLDHPASPSPPPARSSVLDVRALRQTALGVSPPPASLLASRRPVAALAVLSPLRQTSPGVALQREAPVAPIPYAASEEVLEDHAFPLIRATQPSGTMAVAHPPAVLDPVAAMPGEIDMLIVPVERFDLSLDVDFEREPVDYSDVSLVQASAYAPLQAPPIRSIAPVTPVGWWWPVGGAVLVFCAGVALRGAPLAVALRAAAAVASLLMLVRFGALTKRALLLVLVALPALAQETLSIDALSREGAAVFMGALVLLPTGAWIGSDRQLLRRVFLVAGVALTIAVVLMDGGVPQPWDLGAAPVLALALMSLVTPARWASVSLTAALMGWSAVCGASSGARVPTVANVLAMAALVLLCGRALAVVLENDEG